jgi:hypothetical protein
MYPVRFLLFPSVVIFSLVSRVISHTSQVAAAVCGALLQVACCCLLVMTPKTFFRVSENHIFSAE